MEITTNDLKKYNYFSGLSEDALQAFAQGFEVLSLPAGAEVVAEGTEGDAFYFIRDGRLELTKRTRDGQSARLSVIGSGHGFGEMSLLTGSPRACSVRSVKATKLYKLPKGSFEEIVGQEPAFLNMLRRKTREFEHYNKIKILQPFAMLDPDKMFALMARMTERTYSQGEDIIVQGDKGDFYYIVKSGSVSVLQKKKGEKEPRQIAFLTEGDGFGEEALIRDDPRNATCRAAEETVVYVLDRTDFDQILKSSYLDNIFAEDINTATYRERYVVIDARVPEEYAEEHIEGALSIPVEKLRLTYKQLDPAKEYITYCTNDARGMVAAFLLKNHGYKAKCLRGGISSWEGATVKWEGKQ